MTLEISTPASSRLLHLALSGLLSAGLTACLDDDDKEPAAASDSKPQVLSTKKDETMSFARFLSECEARGGLVQTHAACSGANSCKGLSFNKYSKVLTEHTCKAMNTCGGMSCVDLPADSNSTGAAIYEASCQGCHTTEAGEFILYVPKGTDLATAEAKFLEKTVDTQVTIVAFGTRGVNADSTAYSNMPAYHEKLSRAEIKRVVEYLRTLPPKAKAYDGSDLDVGDDM